MSIGLNKLSTFVGHLACFAACCVFGLGIVCCSCHTPQFQSGDLLFVEGRASGAMEQAIMGSTGAMVHVGIIEVRGDSVFVIDAAPKTGVSRRTYAVFLEAQKDGQGNMPAIRIMRLKDNSNARDYVAKAKSLCGVEYDFTFLPDNGQYYCSELVHDCYAREGKPLFEAAPMNFRNAEGVFDSYWVELFEAQGMDIPQDVLGTNPDDLFHSPLLISVY